MFITIPFIYFIPFTFMLISIALFICYPIYIYVHPHSLYLLFFISIVLYIYIYIYMYVCMYVCMLYIALSSLKKIFYLFLYRFWTLFKAQYGYVALKNGWWF